VAVIKVDDELYEEVRKYVRRGHNRFEFPSVKAFVDLAIYNALREKEEKGERGEKFGKGISGRKQAQLAAEFLYVVGFALIVVVLFVVASESQLEDLRSDREFILIKDLAHSVRTELTLAAEVEPGYERNFTTPANIDGKEYQMRVQGTSLITSTEKFEYVLRVPALNGNLNKGNNLIRNVGGGVYLN